jgi:SNARE protein
MRTFTRRMATDRLILFFTFLVFAGIAGIIVYASMYPDQDLFYVPDQVKPPDPNGMINASKKFLNDTYNSAFNVTNE